MSNAGQTVVEWGIVWDDRPEQVTWVTRDPDDSTHRDILADELLSEHATRVQRTVIESPWEVAS